jgi:hypothetical protein
MKIKNILLTMLLFVSLVYSQTAAQTGIKPYPGAEPELEAKATAPLIPPIISQLIIVVGIVVIGALMITVFIIVMLFIVKMIFGDKKLPEAEIIMKERVASCKSWNGTQLGYLELSGDGDKVPQSTIGHMTGFKAEGAFDYMTYHTGAPPYMFLFKMLSRQGSRFQLHIPIIDITIPPDHIVQIEQKLHSALGRRTTIYASGLQQAQSHYEMPNNSTIKISERMGMERDEMIARMHGATASLLPELSENLWESGKEYHKKKGAESSRAPAGK